MKTKALVIFYPGSIEYEIIMAAQLFHQYLSIDLATPEGADFPGDSGLVFRPTHSYASVNPGEYQAVLVPGGDTGSVIENARLEWILKTAAEADAAIGGICAGPELLAKAGLLKGRRFTNGYSSQDAAFHSPLWEGGSYQDQMVVVDGKIVTAKPEAHVDFAVELLYASGLRALSAVEYVRRKGKLADYPSEIEAVKAAYNNLI